MGVLMFAQYSLCVLYIHNSQHLRKVLNVPRLLGFEYTVHPKPKDACRYRIHVNLYKCYSEEVREKY